MSSPLLQVEDLSVHFTVPGTGISGTETIRAVDGISLTVQRGRTLGLVGESGCGKSTTGFAILKLVTPAAGRILIDGVDVAPLDNAAMRPFRRRLQIIFQDANASLDPRMSVGDLIAEPLDIHGLARGPERSRRIHKLLDLSGLPARITERYPHELSGGQGQRVAICRALAVEPELIVCDEPVSALDVSIQAQIVNLLKDLQSELDLTYLFISHDLSVVRHLCDDVAVMYLGRIVEIAGRDEIFERPSHPYTRALLSAVPVPDPDVEEVRERVILQGDLPSPASPPSGCRFRTRCPIAIDACAATDPQLISMEPGHAAACIRIEETV